MQPARLIPLRDLSHFADASQLDEMWGDIRMDRKRHFGETDVRHRFETRRQLGGDVPYFERLMAKYDVPGQVRLKH